VDEATRQGSEAVGARAGEAPTEAELRRDIAATREDLGETVAALVEKTDVKAQAKSKVQSVKQTALRKKRDVVGQARETSPDNVNAAAQRAVASVRSNPVAVYVAGALALGVLIGRRGRRD
jgi:ElaB/YqjD/DUF883 family membrane-anchored ribosome-binding protein